MDPVDPVSNTRSKCLTNLNNLLGDLQSKQLFEIADIIQKNSSVIGLQTPDQASEIRKSLESLSERVLKNFPTPAGYNLAFEIMGRALGVFSKEEKPAWEALPDDILPIIFSNLVENNSSTYLVENNSTYLSDTLCTSKAWSTPSEEVYFKWIDETSQPLILCCKTKEGAINLARIRKFVNVNLVGFNINITDADLKTLLHENSSIKSLYIENSSITKLPDNKLNYFFCNNCPELESLPEMAELLTITLYCHKIETICHSLNLKSLEIIHCNNFTKIPLFENLTHYCVQSCPKFKLPDVENFVKSNPNLKIFSHTFETSFHKDSDSDNES